MRNFAQTMREKFPNLNVLINNAGIQSPESLRAQFENLTELEAMAATNLLGPIPPDGCAVCAFAGTAKLSHSERVKLPIRRLLLPASAPKKYCGPIIYAPLNVPRQWAHSRLF